MQQGTGPNSIESDLLEGHRSAQAYSKCPVLNGRDTELYHHRTQLFDFTALDGKDKWTVYRFKKHVCDTWEAGCSEDWLGQRRVTVSHEL